MRTEKEYQLIFTCRTRRPFVAPTKADLQEMKEETHSLCQVVQFRAAELDEIAIVQAVAKGLQLDKRKHKFEAKDFHNPENGYLIYTCLQDEQGQPLTGSLENTRIYIADYTFYIRELVPVDLERLGVFVCARV